MKKILSFLLCALFLTACVPAIVQEPETVVAAASNPTEITASTVWKYLDNNEDPAGANNTLTGDARLTWTKADYNDSAWKSAAGPFGSKKGSTAVDTNYTANTLLEGVDGTNNYYGYFFRTELYVEDASKVVSINGSVQYDDSMIIYINGTPIASGGVNTNYTKNLEYCKSATSPIGSVNINVTDTSMLKDGINIVAVELHQDDEQSSDAWFCVPALTLTINEPEFTNINVNLGSNPRQMNFTWHFNNKAQCTLLVAPTSRVSGGEMPADALSFTASAPAASSDGINYYSKVVASGLTYNTEYSYQIVSAAASSKIYTFKTGSSSGEFSFVFCGDPQVGREGTVEGGIRWGNTLKLIDESPIFDDIAFMLNAGDHVEWSDDEEMHDQYFDHEELYNLPVIDVIGNHDSYLNGHASRFLEHHYLPNQGEGHVGTCITSDGGGSSWVVYNNVLFINLNTNHNNGTNAAHAAAHKAFMQEAIAANPDVSWKVVATHYSMYAAGYHSQDAYPQWLRENLAPIFSELGIDVVFMGHDHSYCRTFIMDGVVPITDVSKYDDATYSSTTDPDGVLYITGNSSSGNGYYDLYSTAAVYPYMAVRNQEYTPNVSKVTVSDTQFSITTYRTTDLSIVDTFTINRTKASDPVVEPYDYSYSQNAQIKLIEPWGLKANINISTQYGPMNYDEFYDYGVYFIRKSDVDRLDVSEATITAADIVNDSDATKYTKADGVSVINMKDSQYLSAIYDKKLYTYEFSDSVFVMYYIIESAGADPIYAPIRERNISGLVNERKSDTSGEFSDKEKDVYSSMAQLEEDVIEYRSDFTDLNAPTEQELVTLGQYQIEGQAVANSSYAFAHNVQIKLIEPWGMRLNAKVTLGGNTVDYSTLLEYGAIVSVTESGSTPSAAELMSDTSAYVLSSKRGDASINSSGYISVEYYSDIFTYQLDRNVYVMFYLVDGEGMIHTGPVKERNLYELMKERAADEGTSFTDKEKAVYTSMIGLRDTVIKYRADFLN